MIPPEELFTKSEFDNRREIPLSQGKVVIVDASDYDWLMQWKWYYNGQYAVRNIRLINRKRKRIFMHRVINNTPKNMVTDHRDCNKLNNCRSNLRDSNQTQNQHNQLPCRGTSSLFKGVHWHKRIKKWVAQISVNKKQLCLGYFASEIQAALTYNEAARKYCGEFARTNNVQS